MTEIIGVRFQRSGKVYYFDPEGRKLKKEQGVIVETERGMEFGTVSIDNIELPEEMIPQAVLPILRIADEEDQQQREGNWQKAQEAFLICEQKILEHGLDMHLVESEYTFDRSKLTFYFTSEDRVDFRKLVRDLAQTFRTRIELRQIGVRDQAKMIGGIGACGQEICCHRYMTDFAPVSIKMAKTQGLSLNPTKISGICGRLMCCLNYEQDVYLENVKKVPAKGTLVLTEDGQGYVLDRDVLQKRVRVHVYKEDNTEDEHYYPVDEIEVLARRKKGQPRPDLLPSLEGHVFVTEGEKRKQREAEAQQTRDRCGACCGGCTEDPLDSAAVVCDSLDVESEDSKATAQSEPSEDRKDAPSSEQAAPKEKEVPSSSRAESSKSDCLTEEGPSDRPKDNRKENSGASRAPKRENKKEQSRAKHRGATYREPYAMKGRIKKSRGRH